jgi:hypothetical protein
LLLATAAVASLHGLNVGLGRRFAMPAMAGDLATAAWRQPWRFSSRST